MKSWIIKFKNPLVIPPSEEATLLKLVDSETYRKITYKKSKFKRIAPIHALSTKSCKLAYSLWNMTNSDSLFDNWNIFILDNLSKILSPVPNQCDHYSKNIKDYLASIGG